MHRSDLSSEANSSRCHNSETQSHFEWRVVLSAWGTVLQTTLSGSSFMCSRKSVRPRTEL